jgi:hypothetical protein
MKITIILHTPLSRLPRYKDKEKWQKNIEKAELFV